MDRATYDAHEPTARVFLEAMRKKGKAQIYFKSRAVVHALWQYLNQQPLSSVDVRELLDFIQHYRGQKWNATLERWEKRPKMIEKRGALQSIRDFWRHGLSGVDPAKFPRDPPTELEIGAVPPGKRREMYFTPSELQRILTEEGQFALLQVEKTMLTSHASAGGREGTKNNASLLGMRWEDIDMKGRRCTMHEPKTKAAPAWLDVPLDLFSGFGWWDAYFIPYWEAQGRPTEGWCWRRPDGKRYTYDNYKALFRKKIRAIIGVKKAREYVRDPMTGQREVVFFDKRFTPHDMRRTHVQLLRLAGVPMEIISGDAPVGVVGVGWEDLTTLKKFYGAFNEEDIRKNRALAAAVSLDDLQGTQTDMEGEPTGETLKQERAGL